MTDFATTKIRTYLSADHLWTARHNAKRARSIEESLAVSRKIDPEYRSCVITSVSSAVAFLEALVNEVYDDAGDMQNSASVAVGLTDQARAQMAILWESYGKGGRHVNVLEKYQLALLMAGQPQLDKGANPYQNVPPLIELRNALVHYRPEWYEHGELAGQSKRMSDTLEKHMGQLFEASTLLPPGSQPWFPAAALGAGCAEWAYSSSKAFADKWTTTLGITRVYDIVMQQWDAESGELDR
jgi:hypothetical protein